MSNFLRNTLISSALLASAYVMAAPMQTAQGTGVVKAIDAKAASITLAHDPIPALKWSAMTMPFKLAKPELAKGLAVGQKVSFDVEMAADHQFSITAIRPAK